MKNTPPLATYRIQLNKDFTFENLVAQVDYLSDLGISHLYLSPIMESTPGSVHGYDCIDFSQVSVERGGEIGLRALDKKLRERDMGIILDIVPNHMAASPQNPYWYDVLKHGRASEYWKFFDFRVREKEKIELPVLTGSLETHIEKKEIKLEKIEGQYTIVYASQSYPLNKKSNILINRDISLSHILDLQHYKFVPWQRALSHMSYRRFFDITGLIALRMEDEEVYQKTHAPLFGLIDKYPSIQGVRVDHIDGLSDPAAYLERLAKDVNNIWVEKILTGNETLAEKWHVRGTTGYEFIRALNHVFIQTANFKTIENGWKKFTQSPWNSFEECVWEAKREVLENTFYSELGYLSDLAEENQNKNKIFWTEITTFLPVYRTYCTNECSEIDQSYIKEASALAGKTKYTTEKNLPHLLKPQTGSDIRKRLQWQQLSGPVMAKGLEDTAHYRYTPLTALNEVGCEARMNTDFNLIDFITKRNRLWPYGLLATTTHDTKRSEDARARLYALSSDPQAWITFATETTGLLNSGKASTGPSKADEYLFLQGVLATWPLDNNINDNYRNRILQYMRKASREKKRETSWIDPDAAYEEALEKYINAAFENPAFCNKIKSYAERLAYQGAILSLSALTLKILMPGIPDIYQGTENWDFSLVDPDNRRRVNYDRNRNLLQQAELPDPSDALKNLCASWKNGAIKIWLLKRLLRIRKDHLHPVAENLILNELPVTGSLASCLRGYRIHNPNKNKTLLILHPCNPAPLCPDAKHLTIADAPWNNTRMELGQEKKNFTNLLTGALIKGEDMENPLNAFRHFPVLIATPES